MLRKRGEVQESSVDYVIIYTMKMILAVSGGVDSMVMLDIFAKKYASSDICSEDKNPLGDIIVAHFDHGIRKNSPEDAEFVRQKAAEYGLKFQLGRGDLGPGVSEAEARKARYDFLRGIDPSGIVFTAHHLDDLVETVAINLLRGTGWRGLAALDAAGIRRPFLETEMFYEPLDKAAIIEYAAKRGLSWREDQSNSSDEYLRNRIRHEMNNTNAAEKSEGLDFGQKLQIYELWRQQKILRKEIERNLTQCLPEIDRRDASVWERNWLRELDEDETGRKVARELLKTGLERVGVQATRPQIEDFRQAILDYAPGKKFNLPGDRLVEIKKTTFCL